jgi:nitrous oxide reductase accessory protein NosL
MRYLKRMVLSVLTIMALAGMVFGAGPVQPRKMDKCPVCGMMVAKFPKWTAEIVFKDGSYAAFDGPKDMFRFYFHMSKYTKKTHADIEAIYVTDYYTGRMVNARAGDVYFVVGSDVMGPMGMELVPVKGRSNAETFMKDHKGKKALLFGQVTPSVLPKMKMKHMKMKKMMRGC